MALSQIYSAEAGHVITAARWNNEFGNIYGNGTDISFPVTKAVSFAGFTVTLDVAGVTTLSSSTSQAFIMAPGSKTGTPGVNGNLLNLAAGSFQDTNTAASGTAALWTGVAVRTPSLSAANLSVTTTRAATVYIEGAPTASTNETLTDAYALLVDGGKAQFDGDVQIDGTLLAASANADLKSPSGLANYKIVASVGGGSLTISLKTLAGTDPSSADPVRVRFRNATLSTGGTTSISITTALSLVVSSGSTIGSVSGIPNRLYVGLLNFAGTPELFVYNTLNGKSLRGLSESVLLTTSAEGGAGAADSAHTAYSATLRSGVAIRILGYIDSTQATAGTWATSPSTIQEIQPWVPRTGAVVGSAFTDVTSSTDITTLIPQDDTIPQSGEGQQILLLTYVPTYAINYIKLSSKVDGIIGTVAQTSIVSLFTDVSSDALASAMHLFVTGMASTSVLGYVVTNSAMTNCELRAGRTGATTFTFNGGGGASTDLSANMNTFLQVEELMV